MSVLESKLEIDVVEFCNSQKILCEKLKLASQSGWPDRTLMYKGSVMFLELKKQGEKPKPLQAYTMERLMLRGFRAQWADNYELATKLIKDWKSYVDNR